MKKTFKVGTLAISLFVIFGIAGCLSDGDDTNQDAIASIAMESKVVSKAALIDALWDIADEPDPDAVCLANSKLYFEQETAFMIVKTTENTEYNTTPVGIVSSVNIVMPDAATDGRSTECGTEPAKYIVSASETAPIDIETSESMSVRLNLETKAGYNPTPYPTGCRVVAHFEKHGNAPEPVEEAVEETPEAEATEEEVVENPEEEEEETVADIAMNHADDVEDDDTEEDDVEDDDTEEDDVEDDDTEEDDVEDVADEETTDEVEDEEVVDAPAEAAAVYTLKLVIDEYNCSQQTTSPTPTTTPETPQTWQKPAE